jgi:UDP-glucose 4-epimerase
MRSFHKANTPFQSILASRKNFLIFGPVFGEQITLPIIQFKRNLDLYLTKFQPGKISIGNRLIKMGIMNILVTGAAGYIGSVVTERLLSEGYHVIALDNLQQGHRQALSSGAHFVLADLADSAVLDDTFSRYQIGAVMHFAGYSLVGESMTDPGKYFNNNLVGGLNLLNGMVKHGVKKLIFSSSASVYGTPATTPITEDALLAPINPYGETKMMFEKILKRYEEAYGLRSISLRYFNAAGATSIHGEHHAPETHLIPNVLKAALKKTRQVSVFGNQYETKDGTCVRDYVHVVDIADAHLKALSRIDCVGGGAYNLGSENGYSVLEVIKTAERVTGVRIPVAFKAPRAGDPPVLVASSKLARKELGWTPQHYQLEDIITSAWQWQSKFPEGYSS